MAQSSGRAQFQSSFEISPIIFVNGIAGNPGQGVPITNYLNGSSFPSGITGSQVSPSGSGTAFTTSGTGAGTTLTAPGSGTSPSGSGSGGAVSTYQNSFAYFNVVSGATLMDNEIGKYPFLNQTVAANAIITQPLKVSLLMRCPVDDGKPYSNKYKILSALKATLDQHIQKGGMFNVVTPSYIYTNCLLVKLTDVSGAASTQVQYDWQWDFEQPLISLQQPQATPNPFTQAVTNQTQVTQVTSTNILTPSAQFPASLVAQGQFVLGVVTATVPSARTLQAASAGLPTNLFSSQ